MVVLVIDGADCAKGPQFNVPVQVSVVQYQLSSFPCMRHAAYCCSEPEFSARWLQSCLLIPCAAMRVQLALV